MRSSRNVLRAAFLSAIVLFLSTAAYAADVIHVDRVATGAGDGTSWEDAYRHLHDALAAAEPGAEIRVAEGVYTPKTDGETDPRKATFRITCSVSIYGGFPAGGGDQSERDPNTNATILAGDLGQNDRDPQDLSRLAADPSRVDNCYRVVRVYEAAGPVTLDGLIVTGGHADHPDGIWHAGGGLYNASDHLTLSDCKFDDNYAQYGAALCSFGDDLAIARCSFERNVAEASGGALYLDGNDVQIAESDLVNNTANWGGAVAALYTDNLAILQCRLGGNTATANGGGVYVEGGSFCGIAESDLMGNTATLGGGAAAFDTNDLAVIQCDLSVNEAAQRGGGIYLKRSSLSLTGSSFVANIADDAGGGSYCSSSPDVQIVDCRFYRNQVKGKLGCGGALAGKQGSNLKVVGCTFARGNTAAFGGAVASDDESCLVFHNSRFCGNRGSFGAGISAHGDSNLLFTNCVFSGNSANQSGGAAANYDGSRMRFANCTFYRNREPQPDHGAIRFWSPLMLTNCILWDDDRVPLSPEECIVSYSCVRGDFPGEGNISSVPLFVDPDGLDNVIGTEDDNLRLRRDSPCLDAGDNRALAQTTACGFWHEVDTDLDGGERFQDEPDVADTGSGTSPIVDLGAYEGGRMCPVLEIAPQALQIDEGGTAEFTVSLAHRPQVPVEVIVARQYGDPDIRVVSGASLVFDAQNYSVKQKVLLVADEDADVLDGTAVVAVTVDGVVSVGVAVSERDNEPVPTTVYVDQRASGANDGSSWRDAYTDLQQALRVARTLAPSGQLRILVAGGTYTPTGPDGDRFATFEMRNGICLYGGYAGSHEPMPGERDVSAYETILSGDLNGDDEPNFAHYSDNVDRVVTANAVDATALLDGFTIQGGEAAHRGGGVYCMHSHLRVVNCTFRANRAWKGGGMSTEFGGPTLINCTFVGNTVQGYGGAALATKGGRLRVINCRFFDNSAECGGAVHCRGHDAPLFRNCIFRNNQGRYGGVMFIDEGNPTLINCTLVDNSSSDPRQGNALWSYMREGDGPSDVRLHNCILWNGGGEIYNQDGSLFRVTFCTIQGDQPWPGEGNRNDDPLLTSDGHLIAGSPCIDAGCNDYECPGDEFFCPLLPLGVDADLNVRRYDDPDAVDSGLGNGPIVDMGAHEFGSHPIPPVLYVNADANGANVGTDWANAFVDLQTALQTALIAGDAVQELWVTQGVYRPAPPEGNREATFALLDGLAIYGGFEGDEIVREARAPHLHETILSGDLGRDDHLGSDYRDDNSYHVVTAVGVNAGAVLDGFVIRSGHADEPNGVNACGGGLFLESASPTLGNCTFVDNGAAAHGGGIYAVQAELRLRNCTILHNQPDGVWIADGSVDVGGIVQLSSCAWNGRDVILAGNGTLRLTPEAVMILDDARIRCRVEGPGILRVGAGSELVVEGDAALELGSDAYPGLDGRIECQGLLHVKDRARIGNAVLDVVRAAFEDQSIVANCVIDAEAGAPYGQFYVEDQVVVSLREIHADGDRYLDLDPTVFDCNNIDVDAVFVRVTEGTNGTRGGLFELRGQDRALSGNWNEFVCEVEDDVSLPEFGPDTWTITRLELIAGAKLNLTNRFDFQAPYDAGGAYEVLYVRDLILGPNSVLNTAYNYVYCERLTIHPTAKIVNMPLLGFSLNNITFDDKNDYDSRVTHNNFEHRQHPEYSRVHVQRVTGAEPDPAGMMRMCSLADDDPDSPYSGEVRSARAKGVFGKSKEARILVRFEYLFDVLRSDVELDADTQLVVYLSDVPELLDHADPHRDDHYLEVARVAVPPVGCPGSVGSRRFGVFHAYVQREHLNFVQGTRIEFELIGPDGACVLINNWDPQVHCEGYCMDLNGSDTVDEDDLMIVLGCNGSTAELSDDAMEDRSCLDGLFSSDGYVDSYDIHSWDWTLHAEPRQNLCSGLPLTTYAEASSSAKTRSVASGPTVLGMASSVLSDLLILGKGSATANRMTDRLYSFTADRVFIGSVAPDSGRCNVNLVDGSAGAVCQVNSETGVARLRLEGTDDPILSPRQVHCTAEPRYKQSADVYVGIHGKCPDEFGRPILDVAFAGDYLYVVPVVVDPNGKDPYVAAARLSLLESEDEAEESVKLYDDPPLPGDNRLRDYPREIEVDKAGNVYVLNVHSLNESDLLTKYTPEGAVLPVPLCDPNAAVQVPDPVALHVSDTAGLLYLASAQVDPNYPVSACLYGFSLTDLTLQRSVRIQGMQSVTGITEEPGTGCLYVVGFNLIDPVPDSPTVLNSPFYYPCWAEIPMETHDDVVDANSLDEAGDCDLALPTSIIWTGDRLNEQL